MHFKTPTVVRQASLLGLKRKSLLRQRLFGGNPNGAKALNGPEPLHEQKHFSVSSTAKKKDKISKRKRKRLNRIQRMRLAKAIVFHQPNSGKKLTKTTVDYKNVPLLRRYISFEGKILTRRMSRLTSKKQRRITTAIKTARVAGLLPFIRH